MSYKVIRPFKDLSDPEKHDYAVGDAFPRDGHSPSEDFTNGLLTGSNSAGSIFLALVDEAPEQEPELPEATDEEPEQGPELSEATDEEPEQESEFPEATEEDPTEKPKRKRATKKVEE